MLLLNVTDGSDVLSMCTDSDDGLSLETLKSAFPDATNLSNPAYESRKVLLRISNGKIFNPFGWDTNIVYLVHNRSRPPAPVDQDTIMTTPPPPLSRVATQVFNECSDRVYRVHGEFSSIITTTNNQQIQSASQQIGSGVQFQERRILTAAHLKFVVGNEYDLWKNGKTLKATCSYINKPFDFAILESDSLPKTGFSTGILRGGDKFVVLGYPENSNHDDPSVSDGTIEGFHGDGIHLRGAIGSRHGFSGAPVFDRLSYLAGIVIGGRSGVSLELAVKDFAKQLVNDLGTQPSVKILPLSVIHTAQASSESSKDSL